MGVIVSASKAESGASESQVDRWIARVRRHPWFAGIAFVAFVVSQVLQIVGWGLAIEDRVKWREAEYEKLASLRAGFTLEYFESQLGVPVFSEDRAGIVTSATYLGRDYWVHITLEQGVVQSYTVTSCDERFQPTFDMPNGYSITLQQTRLDHLDDTQYRPVLLDYFAQQATAPSHMSEFSGSSNPTHYKAFGWGINAACPMRTADGKSLHQELYARGPDYRGSLDELSSQLRTLRTSALVNTYAETAVGADVETLQSKESLGVDPILARTAATD